ARLVGTSNHSSLRYVFIPRGLYPGPQRAAVPKAAGSVSPGEHARHWLRSTDARAIARIDRADHDGVPGLRTAERTRSPLSNLPASDGQNERVAGLPAHESERDCLLRLGCALFLEQGSDAADRRRTVLWRGLLRAQSDCFQSLVRRLGEQCLPPGRKRLQESK